jgi:hypothetical protein
MVKILAAVLTDGLAATQQREHRIFLSAGTVAG